MPRGALFAEGHANEESLEKTGEGGGRREKVVTNTCEALVDAL